MRENSGYFSLRDFPESGDYFPCSPKEKSERSWKEEREMKEEEGPREQPNGQPHLILRSGQIGNRRPTGDFCPISRVPG